MNPDDAIYVAGHTGLLGSALVRALRAAGFHNLVTRTRRELDLTCQAAVDDFFQTQRPDYVFLAAARVGGIAANQAHPAGFLYENLMMQTLAIHAAHASGVRKLLFVGSSCIYPRETAQPIREETLLTGPLEPTNEGYAIAKIAGMRMCQYYRREYGCRFISAMPTNLFGPQDHYDPKISHLLPALIHRVHQAKVSGTDHIVLWGSGLPRREFMLSDDCADALLFLMRQYEGDDFLNVGTGIDHSVRELAQIVCGVLGADLELRFDTTRPDGMIRKLLDISRLRSLGWKARHSLEEGIRIAYQDYLQRNIAP